jgi:hypothetical protein
MRVRRTGRPVHDRIVEVKKNLRGLFSYPIKLKRRQQPPLNADDVEGRELSVAREPFRPRTGKGLPLRFHSVLPEIGKILLHSKPVALITRVGEEDDSHFVPPDVFSAITKIDLAKSMPRYRWRGTIT